MTKRTRNFNFDAVVTHMEPGIGLPDLSRSTSTGLIRGVKQGDSAAWDRMVAYYSPLVYTWCRRGGLGPDDAAEVMQEVFLAVWRGVGSFYRDQPGQTFRGWLRTVARNKIADHFRDSTRRPQAINAGDAVDQVAEAAESSDDERADRGQLQRLFDRAMSAVSQEFEPTTWRAFMFYTLQNCSAADVAQELGISPAAVRQAKYKILRRLRSELGDAHPSDEG